MITFQAVAVALAIPTVAIGLGFVVSYLVARNSVESE